MHFCKLAADIGLFVRVQGALASGLASFCLSEAPDAGSIQLFKRPTAGNGNRSLI